MLKVLRDVCFHGAQTCGASATILGGLMEDRFEGSRGGLPVLSRLLVFGDLVSFRDDTSEKRELVIFLRPIVIRDASG